MLSIECQQLTIQRKTNKIFSCIDLKIASNQFVGMFGPNGSGKTTLIQTIMGIIRPSYGKLTVLGTSPSKARRNIGYIPQYQGLETYRLTGMDFIASSIRGYKIGLPILTPQDRQDIEKILEELEARELAQKPLSEMSGGQRQRLLLAQALLENPKMIILDEPFSNLDPRWVKSILQLIKKIQHQRSLTILLATHDINPLLPFTDKILCIANQQVIFGNVEEIINSTLLSKLYDFPLHVIQHKKNKFVTSFL